ncbi:hypothetical protein ACSAZK_07305 [Methanosarcina sp. Mfa9]|uniref:hypothetical protein n=1 Tax=Methanosarcina sp. Mfa9 TaxID=3439063 RepID=UPI003F86E4B8
MAEGKTDQVICEACGCELEREDRIEEDGKVFCEDCYIASHHKIKACNPWAVRSKKLFREEAGLEGTDGLTDLQKEIYEFIVSKGGVKHEEIAKKFGISPQETENQFALLRHCELAKGQKRSDGVYLVPFDS